MSTTTHTVAEAADLIGVSERWLADRIRTGAVEHLRFGRRIRFTDQQIADLLAQHTQSATSPAPSAWGQTQNSARRSA